MPHVVLKVDVPITCFRKSRSREYVETYNVPPPATIYGMLLSLVGETDRYKHCGVRIAIALLSKPYSSVVVRKFHRHKVKKLQDPSNIRPDYQEILTNVQFVIWVHQGKDQAKYCLVERILQAFLEPSSVDRFGGLSLGESQFLVNQVTLLIDNSVEGTARWLVQEEYGQMSLPYWVDHVGARRTRWRRYELQTRSLQSPPDSSWTEIKPT